MKRKFNNEKLTLDYNLFINKAKLYTEEKIKLNTFSNICSEIYCNLDYPMEINASYIHDFKNGLINSIKLNVLQIISSITFAYSYGGISSCMTESKLKEIISFTIKTNESIISNLEEI